MEIDQLKAFVTLAETKNFSRTAELLHVVQSSISMRIHALEDSLGRNLFFRTKRHVELSPAGKAFLPYAERVLLLASDARQAVQLEGAFTEHLVVSSTDSLWRHLLRPVLGKFCRQNPATAITTRTGHSKQVIEMILDGSAHLGFVYIKPQLVGMASHAIFEDDLPLVAARNHPSAKCKKIARAELKKLPFITVEWDGPIQEWIRRAVPRDYSPQISLDQLSMLRHLIRTGEGVGFIPRSTIHGDLKTGELVEIKIEGLRPLRRKAYAIHRREKRPRAGIADWLRLAREQSLN